MAASGFAKEKGPERRRPDPLLAWIPACAGMTPSGSEAEGEAGNALVAADAVLVVGIAIFGAQAQRRPWDRPFDAGAGADAVEIDAVADIAGGRDDPRIGVAELAVEQHVAAHHGADAAADIKIAACVDADSADAIARGRIRDLALDADHGIVEAKVVAGADAVEQAVTALAAATDVVVAGNGFDVTAAECRPRVLREGGRGGESGRGNGRAEQDTQSHSP